MSSAARSESKELRVRRATLAKIHVGKQRLGLDDAVYRSIIATVCRGKTSASRCDQSELGRILDALRELGFSEGNQFTHDLDDFTDSEPQARLIRCLWADCQAVGLIKNGSEKGLQNVHQTSRRDGQHTLAHGPRRQQSNRGTQADKAARNRAPRGVRKMNISQANGRARNVRDELADLIRRESIGLAAVARECRLDTATLRGWLKGARLEVELAARIRHWLDDRTTVATLCREVGNRLRGNAVANHIAKLRNLVNEVGEAADQTARDEICDQIAMRLTDIEKITNLMASEQTVRESISPNDRMIIVKSGGKAVGQ